MQDVADAAGVARSTVSKALHDDPTIPKASRERIKALVEKMSYRPHPLIAALMSQLHNRRRRNDPLYLAWIDLWTPEDQASRGKFPTPSLLGARNRAQEIGYTIAVHNVGATGITPSRLRQILLTRSQLGLIFPPVPQSQMRYPFDMTGFTGVAIGTSLAEPNLNRVSNNHYQGGQLACRTLRARGFRKIGLVLSPWNDERSYGRWRASFLLEQQQWPVDERVPALLADQSDEGLFRKWAKRWKPDAILVTEDTAEQWVESLPSPGPRVVWLALDRVRKGIWGINYMSEEVGAVAAELVVGQLQRNERGAPARPRSILIDGEWMEG